VSAVRRFFGGRAVLGDGAAVFINLFLHTRLLSSGSMFIASKAPWRLSLAYISRMSGIDAILSRDHLVPVPILRMVAPLLTSRGHHDVTLIYYSPGPPTRAVRYSFE